MKKMGALWRKIGGAKVPLAPPIPTCVSYLELSEHWPEPILAPSNARELWSEHWPDKS